MAGDCQMQQFIKLLDHSWLPIIFSELILVCALIAILKMSRLPQAAYFYLVCNQRYYFSLPILAESFMMRGRNFTCKNLSQYKMVLGGYDVALLSDSNY